MVRYEKIMSMDAKIITGIGLATIVIVVAAALTIGNNPPPDVKVREQKTISAEQSKILLRPDTYLLKAKNSKVTVVEFGDFECPACGVAHGILKKVRSDYKDKVNFAFREFPIALHKNGYVSAMAAEAAGAQGKFWQMSDKLYDNQDEWSGEKDPVPVFAKYAKEIGINVDKFKQDIQNKKYDSRIKNDSNDGAQLGINATPTFFINNKIYEGVLSNDQFHIQLDMELKKK